MPKKPMVAVVARVQATLEFTLPTTHSQRDSVALIRSRAADEALEKLQGLVGTFVVPKSAKVVSVQLFEAADE